MIGAIGQEKIAVPVFGNAGREFQRRTWQQRIGGFVDESKLVFKHSSPLTGPAEGVPMFIEKLDAVIVAFDHDHATD